MREQIDVPVEIRRLRFQRWRRHRWAMWARTSLFSLLFSVGFLYLFRRVGATLPEGTTQILLLLPVLFCWPWFFLAPYLELLPYHRLHPHGRWWWDQDSVFVRGIPLRWSKFQRYRVTQQWGRTGFESLRWRWAAKRVRVTPDNLPPGFATFGLQTHDRLLERGRWLSIIAREEDVARLAKAAQTHGIPAEASPSPGGNGTVSSYS